MSEKAYARDAYGQALVELGQSNKNIVALDADLSGSTRTAKFAAKFPERFFNLGVAEQNMICTAAGLASCGKIAFVSTFAIFATGRVWDQVRNTVCYNNLNVKIVATHAGITVGPDGCSHQAIGDIGLMRSIPNMTILVPADFTETKEAVSACADYRGPVYLRLGRPKVPHIEQKGRFEIGKGRILREGKDLAIIACGMMVKQSLDAAEILEKEQKTVRVVNMHTLRPLDEKLIIECAQGRRGLVTCEEHLLSTGLGSAVAQVLAENTPVPMAMVGIRDRFGQSGSPEELIKEYNLSVEDIVKACRRLLEK